MTAMWASLAVFTAGAVVGWVFSVNAELDRLRKRIERLEASA